MELVVWNLCNHLQLGPAQVLSQLLISIHHVSTTWSRRKGLSPLSQSWEKGSE